MYKLRSVVRCQINTTAFHSSLFISRPRSERAKGNVARHKLQIILIKEGCWKIILCLPFIPRRESDVKEKRKAQHFLSVAHLTVESDIFPLHSPALQMPTHFHSVHTSQALYIEWILDFKCAASRSSIFCLRCSVAKSCNAEIMPRPGVTVRIGRRPM